MVVINTLEKTQLTYNVNIAFTVQRPIDKFRET